MHSKSGRRVGEVPAQRETYGVSWRFLAFVPSPQISHRTAHRRRSPFAPKPPIAMKFNSAPPPPLGRGRAARARV
eukprot:3189156-Prymnesium_polylepis.1